MELLTAAPRAFDRAAVRSVAAAALEHFRDYGLNTTKYGSALATVCMITT